MRLRIRDSLRFRFLSFSGPDVRGSDGFRVGVGGLQRQSSISAFAMTITKAGTIEESAKIITLPEHLDEAGPHG